jgi:hypothetical protein
MAKTEYRQIESEFTKYGYDFKLIKREGNVALFEQSMIDEDSGDRVVVGYEVVEIIKMEAGFAGPKKYPQPAREVLANSDSWGTKGFSPATLSRAEELFIVLINRIAERESAKVTVNKVKDAIKKPAKGVSTSTKVNKKKV